MSSLCRVCGRTATTQCGQCETTLYCGQACADTDWTQGGHGHLCCDVTEALPLARRLFMESAMPTISAKHRAEADELVESLLLEHCAEQYFIQNPHLIDAYLEPQTPLIGAYAGDGVAAAAAEEDRLIDELAEIRGEALALLEEVHLRDTSEYPGVYGLDAIGQEFGQRSEVWQRDYALLENRFTDKIKDAARAVRGAAKRAGSFIAKKGKDAVAKGKELAERARVSIKRGAASARAKLKSARTSAQTGRLHAFGRNLRTKSRAAARKRKEGRQQKRIRAQGKRETRTKQILERDAARSRSPSPTSVSVSPRSSRSSDSGYSSSSGGESPRPSRSARKRERRRADKQRKADEQARRKEDDWRAAEEAAAQRQLEQDEQRREQERVVETRGRSRTRDDEAYYRSTSREKRRESEERRLKREVKDADRRVADAARLEAERDAAAARQQAKQAQGTVYQPPATATTPTVVVVPAPAPAPVSPSSVSPSHTVQQEQLRTEEDRLNARIVLKLKQLDKYKAQIEELEKDTVMDEKEKERQLDELNGYLAAAKVSYDAARQKLGQIQPQTSMSTTIFWK